MRKLPHNGRRIPARFPPSRCEPRGKVNTIEKTNALANTTIHPTFKPPRTLTPRSIEFVSVNLRIDDETLEAFAEQ